MKLSATDSHVATSLPNGNWVCDTPANMIPLLVPTAFGFIACTVMADGTHVTLVFKPMDGNLWLLALLMGPRLPAGPVEIQHMSDQCVIPVGDW